MLVFQLDRHQGSAVRKSHPLKKIRRSVMEHNQSIDHLTVNFRKKR